MIAKSNANVSGKGLPKVRILLYPPYKDIEKTVNPLFDSEKLDSE